MKRLLLLLGALALGTALSARAGDGFAPSEKQISPVLLGTEVPDAPLHTLDGHATTLRSTVGGKPTVLVFYRGGWCPYCNLQLSQLQKIQPDLQALGYRVLAVSSDTPEQLRKTMDRHGLAYTLVSDDETAAMRAFGIAYKVDADTLRQYHQAGIAPAQDALPVPSVFIVDGDGVIQFSYAHPDFRVRVPGQVVLAAARAIAEKEHKLHPPGH